MLYVRALHRSGYQVEAVRALAAARAALADVGLVPGAALTRPSRPSCSPNGTESGAGAPDASPLERSDVDPAIRTPTPAVTTSPTSPFAGRPAPGERRRRLMTSCVLNPAMVTIDGLLDEPHARRALAQLRQHRPGDLPRPQRHRPLGSAARRPRARSSNGPTTSLHVLDDLGIAAAHVLASFDAGLVAIELAATPPRAGGLARARPLLRHLRPPPRLPARPRPVGDPAADPRHRLAAPPVSDTSRRSSTSRRASAATRRSADGGRASVSEAPARGRRRRSARSPPPLTSAPARRRRRADARAPPAQLRQRRHRPRPLPRRAPAVRRAGDHPRHRLPVVHRHTRTPRSDDRLPPRRGIEASPGASTAIWARRVSIMGLSAPRRPFETPAPIRRARPPRQQRRRRRR